MALDPNSPLPLYYQLKQILAGQIDSGTFQPGDMLPTEHQLQNTHNVSRTTVRLAMTDLESEGKVIRYRGRGTFVAHKKVQHNPAVRPTLTNGVAAATPGWQVLSANWVTPSAHVKSKLVLSNDDEVYCLRRLRLEKTDPIGYHIAYVAPPYAASIDEASFTDGGSLRYLQNVPALTDSTADRVIEAVGASDEVADLLRVEVGDPLLMIHRLVKNPDGVPIEYFRGVYRGDRFEYHINNVLAVSRINE